MKGTTQPGRVKRTQGQRKKHASQLTASEWQLMESILTTCPLDPLILSSHLQAKTDVSFELEALRDLLIYRPLTQILVEANLTPTSRGGDVRLLLRSPDSTWVALTDRTGMTTYQEANLCLVFSLCFQEVVTVYWNRADDAHRSLNWYRYDATLDLLPPLVPLASSNAKEQ